MAAHPMHLSYEDDRLLTGILSCLDGFMNIALEDTQEYVEGVPRGKYGDSFIRGNNGRCNIP